MGVFCDIFTEEPLPSSIIWYCEGGMEEKWGEEPQLQCWSKGSSRQTWPDPCTAEPGLPLAGDLPQRVQPPETRAQTPGAAGGLQPSVLLGCTGSDTGSSSKADELGKDLRPLSSGFRIQLSICVESDRLPFVPDTSRVQHGPTSGVSTCTERLLWGWLTLPSGFGGAVQRREGLTKGFTVINLVSLKGLLPVALNVISSSGGEGGGGGREGELQQ